MRVEPYRREMKALWDQLVCRSKNGTFLLLRDYMEYHSDRFQDASVVIYDDRDDVWALFPANREGNEIISHNGLTYGGMVYDGRATVAKVLEAFEAVTAYYRQQGIQRLRYKAIPYIYHRAPAQEDLYALFRLGARLYRRDIATTVSLSVPLPFQNRRLRGVKKAVRYGIVIRESQDWRQFWYILERNLAERYHTRPVHSVKEIMYLWRNFPRYIRLFAGYVGGEMLGGAVIYETERVAHAQYIASTPLGRKHGVLDKLFYELITKVFQKKAFFDFGISTEQEGRWLNEGLIAFKEGFGGRGVVYDFYEMTL